ncbi:Tat pathway signal sequence [Actinomyces sp. 432]|uniref:Tat pathway signal sequence n=1 Tax=Actinomyces sp. 432 TaxID=2057798 RepID=UPI001373CC40|nr:Tat pathway signal sequence [Actinomyces sp. 432]QHO91217.1 Tat pathway signal sequence [Actinomyces sp. 432]
MLASEASSQAGDDVAASEAPADPPAPARPRRVSRRRALGLLVAGGVGLALAPLPLIKLQAAPGEPPSTGALARLDVAAPDGELMTLSQLLERQTNGVGEEGRDDALLDTDTLELIELAPLQAHGESTACLELPAGGPACLNLSWPTSHGYSALLVDVPGPGRYALAELAARSLHNAQADAVRSLPTSGAEADTAQAVNQLRALTSRALDACAAAGTPVERAALANDALEAATSAQLALDAAAAGSGPEDAMLGVTFTAAPDPGTAAEAIAPLEEAGRTRLVRIVVADTEDTAELAEWRRCATELHDAGVRVMVQVCDSQDLAEYTEDAWRRRLAALVGTFPDADAWEIGNELAAQWTGPDAVARTLAAARVLAETPATAAATRVLTLYYQLGQGTAAESVLSWAAANLRGSCWS